MTGKAAGHLPDESGTQADLSTPDSLEVAPGWEHQKLEGWVPALASR